MLRILKKHKLVMSIVLIDLILFYFLFYSGVALPFINPSIEQYEKMSTSFPRDANQMFIWILVHAPTSFVIGSVARRDSYLFLAVVQTGLITYCIERFIKRKRTPRI